MLSQKTYTEIIKTHNLSVGNNGNEKKSTFTAW